MDRSSQLPDEKSKLPLAKPIHVPSSGNGNHNNSQRNNFQRLSDHSALSRSQPSQQASQRHAKLPYSARFDRSQSTHSQQSHVSLLQALQKHLAKRSSGQSQLNSSSSSTAIDASRRYSSKSNLQRTASRVSDVAAVVSSDADITDAASHVSSNACVEHDMELIELELTEQAYGGIIGENLLPKTKILDLIRAEVAELAQPEINWRKCVLTITVLIDKLLALRGSSSSEGDNEYAVSSSTASDRLLSAGACATPTKDASCTESQPDNNYFDVLKAELGDIWIDLDDMASSSAQHQSAANLPVHSYTQFASSAHGCSSVIPNAAVACSQPAPASFRFSSSDEDSIFLSSPSEESLQRLLFSTKAQLGLRFAVLLGLIYSSLSQLTVADLVDNPQYTECTEECVRALETVCQMRKNHTTYTRFVLERLTEILPNPAAYVPLLRRLYDASLGSRPAWLASPPSGAARKGTPIATPAARVKTFAEQMPALMSALTTRSSAADNTTPDAVEKQPSTIIECLTQESATFNNRLSGNTSSAGVGVGARKPTKTMISVVRSMSKRFPMLAASTPQEEARNASRERKTTTSGVTKKQQPMSTLAHVKRRLQLSPRKRSPVKNFLAAAASVKLGGRAAPNLPPPFSPSVKRQCLPSSAFETPSKRIRRRPPVLGALVVDTDTKLSLASSSLSTEHSRSAK